MEVLLYSGLAIILGLGITAFVFIYCRNVDKKRAQAREQAREEAMKQKQERFHIYFYKKCLENSIYSINSAANRQKAILLGNQMRIINVNESNVDELFKKGEAYANAQKKQEENKKIAEQRAGIQKEEREKFQKYSCLHGRQKRLLMLKEELQSLRKSKSSLETFTDTTLGSVAYERERDWAITGGIASAIGGAGAGVMAASQVQAENEAIKQRNAERKAWASKTLSPALNLILEAEREIKELEAKINKEEVALVDESINTAMCFESLSCDYTSEIDASNILSVSAKLQLKENLTIFETVSAVLDGCLLATMFVNEMEIGKTLLVLPFEGIAFRRSSQVEGKIVLPYDFDKRTNYTIKITPYSLCAIQKN